MRRQWTANSTTMVRDTAREWLTSSAFAELIGAFGGPDVATTPAGLAELRAWTAAHWDTRRGAERRDAPNHEVSPQLSRLIVDAADQLGLLATEPSSRQRYDCMIILAGATTGNRLRTELAATELQRTQVGLLLGTASARPLSDSEYASDPTSRGLGYEWRHLEAEMLRQLRLRGRTTAVAVGDSDLRVGQTALGAVPVRLLVAPDVQGHRPTTVTQLRDVRHRVALSDRRRVLLITSAIYAPYQFFAGMLELLADGADHIELVGTPTQLGEKSELASQRLLQELHAAAHAASGLLLSA